MRNEEVEKKGCAHPGLPYAIRMIFFLVVLVVKSSPVILVAQIDIDSACSVNLVRRHVFIIVVMHRRSVVLLEGQKY